jgi:hypothetical protein
MPKTSAKNQREFHPYALPSRLTHTHVDLTHPQEKEFLYSVSQINSIFKGKND